MPFRPSFESVRYLAGRQARLEELDAVCEVAGQMYPYQSFSQSKDGSYVITVEVAGEAEEIVFSPEKGVLGTAIESALAS